MNKTLLALLTTALGAGSLGGCNSSGKDSPVRLYVNEIMASNVNSCTDENGEHDDWIELYNPGPGPVSLEGFAITDDPADHTKKVFGAGLEVPGDGVLLLWADDGTGPGEGHLPFKLKAKGESVSLYDPDGALVDELSWTDALDDVSWARFPDGGDTISACVVPSCGEKNGQACPR